MEKIIPWTIALALIGVVFVPALKALKQVIRRYLAPHGPDARKLPRMENVLFFLFISFVLAFPFTLAIKLIDRTQDGLYLEPFIISFLSVCSVLLGVVYLARESDRERYADMRKAGLSHDEIAEIVGEKTARDMLLAMRGEWD